MPSLFAWRRRLQNGTAALQSLGGHIRGAPGHVQTGCMLGILLQPLPLEANKLGVKRFNSVRDWPSPAPELVTLRRTAR
jgi:hypothetical protein